MAPVFAAETHREEIGTGTTRWVRDGLDGELPLSDGERLDLIGAGIDLDAIEPGTCLVESLDPGRVSLIERRVLVREASEQLTVSEAVFEQERRRLVTRPAHERFVEVPTVWREGTQRVMTSTSAREGGAAEYGTFPRVTVEQPATLARVREPALAEDIEVARLVEDAKGMREPVPAVWETVEIRRVEEPGTYGWHVEGEADAPVLGAAREGPDASSGPVPTGRRICHREVPPDGVDYRRLVVREQGRFERETLPAERASFSVQALLEEARAERIEVPPVTGTVERRVRTGEARDEWRPVPCAAELGRPLVVRLQRALAREGGSIGTIDGVLGPLTLDAVRRYQERRGLATGALTLETVEALGIALPPRSGDPAGS